MCYALGSFRAKTSGAESVRALIAAELIEEIATERALQVMVDAELITATALETARSAAEQT